MFTSGFFNSINSDRKYNAEQMAAIFDGLITDGIFDSIGDHFQVTPASSGLGVNIGTGRAWLNQTWSYNDTAYPVTLGAASSSLGRKDLICLKVDKSNAVRANSLVVIAGTPAASPVEPTVTDDTTNGIYYHKLAAVTIPKGATSISAANITNYIGLSTGTPYVTGILSSTAVDELWSQWDGEFNDWWDDIKATLDDNVVTTILNKIDHITPKEATMNLYGFSHINPPPSGKTYAEYSTDAILQQINSLLNEIEPHLLGEVIVSMNNPDPEKYKALPHRDSASDYMDLDVIPDIGSSLYNLHSDDPKCIFVGTTNFADDILKVVPKTVTYNSILYDVKEAKARTSDYIFVEYRGSSTSNESKFILVRFDLNGQGQLVIHSSNNSVYSVVYSCRIFDGILLISRKGLESKLFISYNYGVDLVEINHNLKTDEIWTPSVCKRGQYIYLTTCIGDYNSSGKRIYCFRCISINTQNNEVKSFSRDLSGVSSVFETTHICMGLSHIRVVQSRYNSSKYQYYLYTYAVAISEGSISETESNWTTIIDGEDYDVNSKLCGTGCVPFKIGQNNLGILVLHSQGKTLDLYSADSMELLASVAGSFAYANGSTSINMIQLTNNKCILKLDGYNTTTFIKRYTICEYNNGSFLVESFYENTQTAIPYSDRDYFIFDSAMDVQNEMDLNGTSKQQKIVDVGTIRVTLPVNAGFPNNRYFVKQN